MKKHYGQITKTYSNAALISAALMLVCGIILFVIGSIYLGVAEITAGVVVFVWVLVINHVRQGDISEYFKTLETNSDTLSANLADSFPIPVAVAHIDGSVKWCNDKFSSLFDAKSVIDMKIEDIINDVKWGDILKDAAGYEKNVKIGEKSFVLDSRVVKNKRTGSGNAEDKASVYVYLIDKTEEQLINERYISEKTDVAIINIDNYDDVIQRVNDNDQQQILSHIRQCVNDWAEESRAIVKNTDRDRYYVIFEHKYLEAYIEKKFDILDKVRKIGEEIKMPVSVSIGIGTGGLLSENDSYARSALDMALGRGGDQVSVKDEVQYKFYGSKTRDYEKSTRVKTRSTAFALKDFIKNSDKVIFMGHANADYDCFGAALGLQRAVRTLCKKPYIIYDNNSPAIEEMYEEVRGVEEYHGMFISGDTALEYLTSDTLVVVLDTHRPTMLPCPQLVKNAAKVVLIDHHRRSTDFLNPCSLIYHEPYASSTCEMATELMEYMNLGSSLTTLEAECLYTGILMDTKNFIVKTGVRTFEAASYLRRLGLNTADIKKMFSVSKDDYIHRSDIVRTAVVAAPHIAVAWSYEKLSNIRVIASQASDEILNISDIQASIVVYPLENSVGVSARSLGEVNVQLLMEDLGGGGHSTVAGAQIKNKSIDMVVEDVKKAVTNYVNNNAK